MAATNMKIIGFVPSPETAATVIAWVKALADEGEETTFLCYETGFDGRTAQAVREVVDEESDESMTVIAIDDPRPVEAVLTHVRKGNVRMLVTGPFSLSMVPGWTQSSDALVRSSPCLTFAPLYGEKTPAEAKRMLFVVTGVTHDLSALRLADRLRQRQSIQITVGGIEDETGAKAGEFGESWIRGLLHDAALDEEGFEIKIVVNQVKTQGLVELFENQDVVVTGVEAASDLRALQQSLGDATAAIVKSASPVRLSAMGDWMPRINPADHADLIYNLRQGSIWGPDFIGMLGLASAIATLGLLQDSPAVVIGSMLLAPLMTPMIGLGLSMAQGNVRLMQIFGRSIGLGFLLTLGVSCLIGIITPSGATLPDEVLARGGPNVLDLLIAVFAAAAATLAMARPNISGAIAGVAIATALVPPVCSVGISLAHAEWLVAFGATTLFFTNLIAIIVMSSFTFSLLGIEASGVSRRHRRQSVWGRWGLVVMLLALAGPLSERLVVRLEEGMNVPLAHPVTKAVKRAVFDRVAQDEGVELIFIARPRAEDRVVIQLASPVELPESYADELRGIVREAMANPHLVVTVVALRGWWRSDHDTAENVPQ